jgi:hypothetical protein
MDAYFAHLSSNSPAGKCPSVPLNWFQLKSAWRNPDSPDRLQHEQSAEGGREGDAQVRGRQRHIVQGIELETLCFQLVCRRVVSDHSWSHNNMPHVRSVRVLFYRHGMHARYSYQPTVILWRVPLSGESIHL